MTKVIKNLVRCGRGRLVLKTKDLRGLRSFFLKYAGKQVCRQPYSAQIKGFTAGSQRPDKHRTTTGQRPDKTLEREVEIDETGRPNGLAVADKRFETPFADRVFCSGLKQRGAACLLHFGNLARFVNSYLDADDSG